MGNTLNYSVFLDIQPEPKFLFSFRQDPLLRPKKGDVLTQPFTFEQLKIIKDEIPTNIENSFRVTFDGRQRITDPPNSELRVTGIVLDPDKSTHNYFVTPANNPNRIVSWATSGFANDQTLRQLFR